MEVGRAGAVIVVKPRDMSRGVCPCGWATNPRLPLSLAKINAPIHAARHDCGPAIPLIQPSVVMVMERRGILDVDCPQGCSGQLPQVGQLPDRPRIDTRPVIVEATRGTFHRKPFVQLTNTVTSANTIYCGNRRSVARLDPCRLVTDRRLFGKSERET
ncbi:MAG: hypothetical protein QOD90_1489 [Mycobacterium sp.]|jgi:hypothetical protein|nr:hypothetical protein [Mycobacterium sp.]